jgi:hypothetical protein
MTLDCIEDSDGYNWRCGLRDTALNSTRQCNVCALMPHDECLRWHHKREYVQGEHNLAPWCQFFKTKEAAAKQDVCALCGKPK